MWTRKKTGAPYNFSCYTTLQQLTRHQTTQTTEGIRLSIIIIRLKGATSHSNYIYKDSLVV